MDAGDWDVGTATLTKVDRILMLTERLNRIEGAVSTIRYNNDLVTELPEVLRTLGDAKDAVIAELKTV